MKTKISFIKEKELQAYFDGVSWEALPTHRSLINKASRVSDFKTVYNVVVFVNNKTGEVKLFGEEFVEKRGTDVILMELEKSSSLLELGGYE